MAQFKNADERALDLQAKLSALQAENKNLRNKIENIELVRNNACERIEQFVEKWYEENKDLVDSLVSHRINRNKNLIVNIEKKFNERFR